MSQVLRTLQTCLILALTIGIALQTAQAGSADEQIRGVVKPSQEAWLSTELNARILQLARKEGEAFKKNDVLVAFDCDKYETESRAADAERELNLIVLNNSVELDRRQAIGRYEVDQNRAKFDKAKAQAETLAVRLKECKIRAPYDGRVAELKGREFEISSPGQPLMHIVAVGDPEIEMIVPSNWLRWIGPDFRFRVEIDETKTTHTAQVRRIAPVVDSVSQTVKIMAAFTDDISEIRPGMSLSAVIDPPAH